MTVLVSLISMIPIDCKIKNIFLYLHSIGWTNGYMGRSFAVLSRHCNISVYQFREKHLATDHECKNFKFIRPVAPDPFT